MPLGQEGGGASSSWSVTSSVSERFEDAASEFDTLEEADAIRRAPVVENGGSAKNDRQQQLPRLRRPKPSPPPFGGVHHQAILLPELPAVLAVAGRWRGAGVRQRRSKSADFGQMLGLGRREDREGIDDRDDDVEDLPPLETFLARLSHLDLPVGYGSLDLENDDDVLPSTPLTEEQLMAATMVEELTSAGVQINHLSEPPPHHRVPAAATAAVSAEEELEWGYDIRGMMHNAAEQAEEFAISIWHKFQSWKVIHFSLLPQWLQDNDFLHFGHRPPLPTSECFKSIIRIHTETGNIWTHLLGVVAFVGLAAFFLSRPSSEIQFQEKFVFACFFMGAIVCMGLSFTYHTLCCHQNKEVGRLFAKFDYCGISFLTVGSFVPWLYYSFYCEWKPQVIYLSIVIVLGIGAVVVSTFDFFAGPKFRPLRAGVFIFFGLSGIAPATHFGIANGWEKSVDQAAIGWLILMGLLYIVGALLYAMRIPERFFPGKLDIWFHSHQIFHCFVIAGAFVHYHGITLMAIHRLHKGDCPNKQLDSICLIDNVSF